MRRALCLFVALAIALTDLQAAQSAGSVNPATEVAIKAAVMVNLPKFVDYPAGAFTSPTAPFVVGILGDDLVAAAAVVGVFKDKRLTDRPVVVARFSRLEDLQPCHLLYVARSEERRLTQVLDRLGQSPMLTVADFGRFAERGGVISLVVQGDKVRFAINDRAARAAGLKLSSNLLRLATSVIADQ